jgi:hypothetical protein
MAAMAGVSHIGHNVMHEESIYPLFSHRCIRSSRGITSSTSSTSLPVVCVCAQGSRVSCRFEWAPCRDLLRGSSPSRRQAIAGRAGTGQRHGGERPFQAAE